jgi:hypothetical protein
MRNELSEIYRSFAKGFRDGPAIFFAPFVGAWKGIKAEFQRLEPVQQHREIIWLSKDGIQSPSLDQMTSTFVDL